MLPLISIIIPTKNSALTLEDCLVSLKHQSYENIEIIVIDNHSIDATPEIAKKYADVYMQKWPERTAQKNAGIELAKGEYIVFIDSDMVLETEVMTECQDIMGWDAKIWGVCIPERSIWEWFFVQIRAFERSFYIGASVESARFFRREDVKKVGGFEEDIIFFEESLLPQKIESQLWLDCNVHTTSYISHQEGNIRLSSWLRKKFYYGKSLGTYQKKVQALWNIERGENQMNILERYMIFLKDKRFYTKPIFALGVLILKTLEFGAGGIWFISEKLTRKS